MASKGANARKRRTPVKDGQDARPKINLSSQQRSQRPDPDEIEVPDVLPVLPLRNSVTFPGVVVPLSIMRDKARSMLAEILPAQKMILTVAQKNPEIEDPSGDDLYEVGTVMMILKLLRMEDGTQNLIVQGLTRARITDWAGGADYLQAHIEPLAELARDNKQTTALMMNVRGMARRVVDLSPQIPEEAKNVLANIEQPGALADFLASNIQSDLDQKQKLLSETDVTKRLEQINQALQRQVDILELQGKIQEKVRANVDESQRKYFLNEQLKAIRKELGQTEGDTEELTQLRQAIKDAGMPADALREADRQLERLERIPSASPEHNVLRTYLEIMSELPWRLGEVAEPDVRRAEKVLDEDHYDLDKVKRRILEYLAVRKLAPDSRGPILCFVGPPGVGKTSLGRSIARALDRKFIRMSLGGIRDEAELRGHRRTYIGSMPGRIIQELRKVGEKNPVFMLDELDKVGADFRGDPTSALLEILDPAQNNTFQDHYLNVPFDLSNVIFIATANYMGPVPPALRDRMEVIELPGYTREEKLHIARKYLIDRQREQNGLKSSQIVFRDSAIRQIIQEYTREAGVRELERQIGAICRGVAALIASGKARKRTVNKKLIVEMLGPRKYESELALHKAQPGVATGLAYTPTGGTILFVESAIYPGSGKLVLTGQIGDVMKESAQTALSLVKSRADADGIDVSELNQQDIHIHVPAGAVQKDGPSAGVAMFTSLMSLLTKTAVQTKVAMTGEVTLRGLLLPIGGVKEKVLAARQAGISTVILPHANEKDLSEVPEDAREGVEFVFAKNVDDVRKVAFAD